MNNREANIYQHPPYCNCVDCVNRRLLKHSKYNTPKIIKGNPKRTIKMKHYTLPIQLIKLILSVSILSLIIALSFLSYKTFTHQYSPINGSISVLVSLGALIWSISKSNNHKYKYVTPGFLLVSFLALIIFLVTAFAGVSPMSDYKDKVSTWITSINYTIPQPQQANKPDLDSNQLHGTYYGTAQTLGVYDEITMTFTGDTVTSFINGTDKTIHKYFIHDLLSSERIRLTNVATGKTKTHQFKYIAEYDCFTIGFLEEHLQGFTVTFYRK